MSISMGRSILTFVGQSSALRSTQLLSDLPFGNLFASIYLTSPQQKICLTDVGRSFTGTSSARSLISPTNRIGSSSSVSNTIKLDGLAALAAVESNSRMLPPMSGGLNGIAALAAATAIVASSSSTDTSPTICEGKEIDNEDDEEAVLLSPSSRQKNAERRQDLETLLDLPALDDMPNQCPKLLNIYEGVKRHWDIVKDLRYKDGTYVYWNFPRLPWKERNKTSTDVLVADELHYDTIENAGSLQGRQHCATKMRSDEETICAKTWNWRKDMLGMDIFMKSIQLDFECFAYFAYKKPEDVMSDENLQIIRESYAENVLSVVEKECTMCFSSTACLTEHAKWVHGGKKEMQAAYELNRDGYISADNSGKLAAGAHPCTFYNTMKNSPGSLETRVERTDTQGTNYRRLFPGHENDECKYNAGMFDMTSPAFKAAKAAARASSVLGGKTAGRMKTESKDFVNWWAQDGLCRDKEEAMELLAIESIDHHSLYQGCSEGGLTAAERYWDAMEAIEDDRATLEDEVRVFTKQLVMENLRERSDIAFQNQLDALAAYKQEHGNFDGMNTKDKKLAQFCKDMRRARKNPESTNTVCDEDRIAALDALGFEWAPLDQAFQAQLDALAAYKQEHGNFDGMKSNNKKLADFCKHMRRARKNPDSTSAVCDESRIIALDAIGFIWNPFDEAFQTQLDALFAYKQEHGNFDGMRSNNKKLAQFCANMRQARRSPGSITTVCNEDRIAALDDIGFDWNPRRSRAKKPVTTSGSTQANPGSTPPLVDDSLPVRAEFDDLKAMLQEVQSDLSLLEKEIYSSISASQPQGKKRKLRLKLNVKKDRDTVPSESDQFSLDAGSLSACQPQGKKRKLRLKMNVKKDKDTVPSESDQFSLDAGSLSACQPQGTKRKFGTDLQQQPSSSPTKMAKTAIAVGVAAGVAVASTAAASFGTRV